MPRNINRGVLTAHGDLAGSRQGNTAATRGIVIDLRLPGSNQDNPEGLLAQAQPDVSEIFLSSILRTPRNS